MNVEISITRAGSLLGVLSHPDAPEALCIISLTCVLQRDRVCYEVRTNIRVPGQGVRTRNQHVFPSFGTCKNGALMHTLHYNLRYVCRSGDYDERRVAPCGALSTTTKAPTYAVLQ